jgi:hypothetical protein
VVVDFQFGGEREAALTGTLTAYDRSSISRKVHRVCPTQRISRARQKKYIRYVRRLGDQWGGLICLVVAQVAKPAVGRPSFGSPVAKPACRGHAQPLPSSPDSGNRGKKQKAGDHFSHFDGRVQPRMDLTLRCAPVNAILWWLGHMVEILSIAR